MQIYAFDSKVCAKGKNVWVLLCKKSPKENEFFFPNSLCILYVTSLRQILLRQYSLSAPETCFQVTVDNS